MGPAVGFDQGDQGQCFINVDVEARQTATSRPAVADAQRRPDAAAGSKGTPPDARETPIEHQQVNRSTPLSKRSSEDGSQQPARNTSQHQRV